MIKIENVDVYGFEAAIPIRDFPNYKITKDGKVFNKKGVQLKPIESNNGYLRVSLSNGNVKHKYFLIHRLVAEAFIPNPYGLPQVNHIDRNKHNNCVNNLEWCTPLQNLNHSKVIEKAIKAKLTKVECITTGKVYNSFKEIEEKLGLSHSNLVACCNGRRKTCGGLKWRYAE